MKRKESFSLKKEIEWFKEFKKSKINLWRRFIKFIFSLFRSNPKSSQAHKVVVVEETVDGTTTLQAEDSQQEEDTKSDTSSLNDSFHSLSDSDDQDEDTKSDTFSLNLSFHSLFGSDDQEEDTKSDTSSLNDSFHFSSDFKASSDANTVKDLLLEEDSNDTALNKKNNNDENIQDLALSIPKTAQLTHPTKDRPKLPPRRAPTRGLFQQCKVETEIKNSELSDSSLSLISD